VGWTGCIPRCASPVAAAGFKCFLHPTSDSIWKPKCGSLPSRALWLTFKKTYLNPKNLKGVGAIWLHCQPIWWHQWSNHIPMPTPSPPLPSHIHSWGGEGQRNMIRRKLTRRNTVHHTYLAMVALQAALLNCWLPKYNIGLAPVMVALHAALLYCWLP
jgi:hypothetical protein